MQEFISEAWVLFCSRLTKTQDVWTAKSENNSNNTQTFKIIVKENEFRFLDDTGESPNVVLHFSCRCSVSLQFLPLDDGLPLYERPAVADDNVSASFP